MATFKDARDVSAAIAKSFDPVSIALFGSVAREDTGTDLDLLVVVDDEKRIKDGLDLLLHKCLKPYYKKFDIDPFVVSASLLREYLAKGSPFLSIILKEGRLLYMREIVKEWSRQAADELKMAEYLLGGGFSRGACFHAQQAIEKSIKARLLGKGWELQKTHSIGRLIAIGEEFGLPPDISDEDAVFIDSIYRGRYPAEAGLLPLGEPAREDAERAVGLARHLVEEISAGV